MDTVTPWVRFPLAYHNPYNLVNILREIINKNVLILNKLCKIKTICSDTLAQLNLTAPILRL
ncbi:MULTISPECIES: hypothetical protein [Limnospira]|uniref:Transposase n=1 Tax=Limnospira platensis NIES-46 TaxID=1236695 RepID=A0A5M3T6Q5_LIMPL|nr:hypothetical protein [Arthrospira platensis]MDF2207630.1 hypothetical protein [Arthrospira platensis NCB002]MDT9184699.1 hypothetical protein [Limnospira sp. PMC 289.06]BDT15355.1 hypothetical protein N39L_50780 [Arthrospira platensis NIES-39]GCE94302.1 hypothetical protein NIES46_23560 [Arthrospira platensis NIES-46]